MPRSSLTLRQSVAPATLGARRCAAALPIAMQDLPIDARYTLPASCLSWTAERASGPGGQHVNKTSTAVELRFDLNSDHGLGADTLARLRTIAGKRIAHRIRNQLS